MRALVLLAALAACSGHATVHDAPKPAKVGTGPSLYELALPLTSQSGSAIRLDVDRGHPTLVSMFYGSCTAACPALIDRISRTLDEAKARDARVLLVSFDPARDTPDKLAVLAREHHLDARWTLAAASPEDARTLAAVLGIKYRVLQDGEFFHTSVVVALDGSGATLARAEGLGDSPALVEALRP